MKKVEPTPETPDEASVASTELLLEDVATLRRWGRTALRYCAVGALGGVVALGVGNRGGVDSTVGGAEVTTKLAFDPSSSVTVESAPLSLKFDHKTDIPLVGVDVNITNVTVAQPNTTSDASNAQEELSTKNIVESMGVLEDPKAVANKLVTDYEHQAAIWAGSGFLGGIALMGALDLAKVTVGRHKKALVASLSAGTIVATGALSYQPTGHNEAIEWSRLTVPVGGENYTFKYTGALGEWAAGQYAKNEKIYNTIQGNLEKALKPIAKEDAALHPKEKKWNVFSDWHCNVGMARGIGMINKTMGVNATMNVGDNAVGGTSQESMCADILSYNIKDTAKANYLGPGNHDFNFLIDEFEQDGVKVMNGKMMMVDGVKVMGFADPTTSPAGVDIIHSRDHPDMSEDQVNALVDKFKQDATEKTCKENPAILIIHEPQQTTNAAMNCATLTINGHTHVVQLPRQTSPDHTVINDGTIGGAATDTESIINNLGKEATSYIIYVADGQPVGLRLITIKKDGAVEVSEYMPVPHPITDKQAVANDSVPLPRHLPGYAASDIFDLAA